jgi:ribosome-associated protein
VRDLTSLQVTRSLRIPVEELQWSFSGSGGPGGQHANTSNTRVSLVWDIEASAAPGPRQRATLLARFGPTVRVVASDERSQSRNRELALDRLRQRVADALHVDPPRRPTRPTRASTERRLEAKRRVASRKRDRQAGPPGD